MIPITKPMKCKFSCGNNPATRSVGTTLSDGLVFKMFRDEDARGTVTKPPI